MASTYSDLKIELIGTGDQSGTWGDTTNDNLGIAIEQAIVGKADVTISSASVTLTLTDSNALQDARALFLNLTGTPGSAATLNVPAIEKNYIVKNGTNEDCHDQGRSPDWCSNTRVGKTVRWSTTTVQMS
jgi:hypothetical protein